MTAARAAGTTTTTRQTLVIEDFPSVALARALSPNGRGHWSVKDNARKVAAKRIAVECRLADIQPFTGRTRITMRWVFPSDGRHDQDNLVATAKPFIDALVRLKLLPDDSSKFVEIAPPEIVVERKRRALEIILEAVDE